MKRFDSAPPGAPQTTLKHGSGRHRRPSGVPDSPLPRSRSIIVKTVEWERGRGGIPDLRVGRLTDSGRAAVGNRPEKGQFLFADGSVGHNWHPLLDYSCRHEHLALTTGVVNSRFRRDG